MHKQKCTSTREPEAAPPSAQHHKQYRQLSVQPLQLLNLPAFPYASTHATTHARKLARTQARTHLHMQP